MKNNAPKQNEIKSVGNLQVSKETDRLLLKTLMPDNYSPDYVGWLNNPEINCFLEVRHTKQTPEGVKTFVGDMLASEKDLMLGIFLKSGEHHIGNIKIGQIDWRHRRGDIGILIGDKKSWGRGYATEAIAGLLDIAFNDLGLQRVQAGCYADNAGSMRAFLKAGFAKEGVFRDYWIVDGKPVDQLWFGKTSGG